ncbi:hypothetical protein [Rhodanobacter lindaniclasticus]|nr:hypothetical protein [Rhodanobacter lindaniclasticus]
MNRNVLFAMGLTLLAPAAWAQTAAKLDPGSASQVIRNQEREHREMQNATRYMEEARKGVGFINPLVVNESGSLASFAWCTFAGDAG